MHHGLPSSNIFPLLEKPTKHLGGIAHATQLTGLRENLFHCKKLKLWSVAPATQPTEFREIFFCYQLEKFKQQGGGCSHNTAYRAQGNLFPLLKKCPPPTEEGKGIMLSPAYGSPGIRNAHAF